MHNRRLLTTMRDTPAGLGLLVLSVMFVSNIAHADIHNCRGVWTNRGCEDSAQGKALPEAPFDPESSRNSREQSRKRTLVTGLQARLFKASREDGVEVVWDDVRALCEDTSTSLETCASRIREIDAILAERLSLARSTPTPASTARIQDGGGESPTEGTLVTVVENNYYQLHRRRRPRPPYYDPMPPYWQKPYTPTPDHPYPRWKPTSPPRSVATE
jgi:hypothetical protein